MHNDHLHSHSHLRQFGAANPSNVHVSRLENSCRQNMRTPHRVRINPVTSVLSEDTADHCTSRPTQSAAASPAFCSVYIARSRGNRNLSWVVPPFWDQKLISALVQLIGAQSMSLRQLGALCRKTKVKQWSVLASGRNVKKNNPVFNERCWILRLAVSKLHDFYIFIVYNCGSLVRSTILTLRAL